MGRFVNGDGYADTGMNLTSSNMFSYCGNNPVMRADPSGEFWIAAIVLGGIAVTVALVLSGSSANVESHSVQPSVNNASKGSNFNYSRGKSNGFVPRKDPKKGSERRQPTNSRERNVKHPNGEEHSRVPKGNGTGIFMKFVCGITITAVVVGSIADDTTIVGIVDDGIAAMLIKFLWDLSYA